MEIVLSAYQTSKLLPSVFISTKIFIRSLSGSAVIIIVSVVVAAIVIVTCFKLFKGCLVEKKVRRHFFIFVASKIRLSSPLLAEAKLLQPLNRFILLLAQVNHSFFSLLSLFSLFSLFTLLLVSLHDQSHEEFWILRYCLVCVRHLSLEHGHKLLSEIWLHNQSLANRLPLRIVQKLL